MTELEKRLLAQEQSEAEDELHDSGYDWGWDDPGDDDDAADEAASGSGRRDKNQGDGTPRWMPARAQAQVDQALRRIDALIGADACKSWIRTQERLRRHLVPFRTRADFPMEHLLFVINPGNGLTTVLEAMRDYLAASGLYGDRGDEADDERSPLTLLETGLPFSEHIAFNREEAFSSLEEALEAASPAVVCLDLAPWLQRLEDPQFDRLLALCVTNRHRIRFVFSIPELEPAIVERVRRRLTDRLPLHTIPFVQPDMRALCGFLGRRLAAYGLRPPQGADIHVARWIRTRSGLGRAHGFRSLADLAEVLAVAHGEDHPHQAGGKRETMDAATFLRILEPDAQRSEQSGAARLAALRGLEGVRRQIEDIVQSAVAWQRAGTVDAAGAPMRPPCRHMLFTGNPGTGKTEVARIVGQLFQENGLLPEGDLVEVNRFDLVGEYVGQTGPKTVSACHAALGSILFVDEAYLLSIGADTSIRNDFGQEAIGALIAEMENRREHLVVILAGYREEMEGFLAANPGLTARIPFRIDFPDYDRETLASIFLSMLGATADASPELALRATAWFGDLPASVVGSRHFGNARYARNLAERVLRKALMRLDVPPGVPQGKSLRPIATIEDFDLAVAEKDAVPQATERRPIGFTT